MLFKLCEAFDMILIVITRESNMTVNANERRRSTSSKRMILGLFLFESRVAVGADEGYHFVEV
jgi:hypothetical protein